MATSGNTIKQFTRNELIDASLRKLSAVSTGQTPSTEDYTNASVALNMLMAYLRTKGLQLWSRKTFSFSPTLNVPTYTIGVGQTLNTPFPLKIIQAVRNDASGLTNVDMEIVADFNFNRYPGNSGGYPLQLTYQPNTNYGVLKLWPTPDTAATTSTITITYLRPLEYFDAATNTLDMPEEWYLPIVYELAKILAPEWAVPLQDRQLLMSEAKQYMDQVESFGGEDTSITFQVARH